MVTDDAARARLRGELKALYGERLEAILLYGSRARGDARADSDYDIAVVIRGYSQNLAEVNRLAAWAHDFLLETGLLISAKPFAPEDLQRRTLFMHNLRRDAVDL